MSRSACGVCSACAQALDVRLEFDEAGVLRENADLVKVRRGGGAFIGALAGGLSRSADLSPSLQLAIYPLLYCILSLHRSPRSQWWAWRSSLFLVEQPSNTHHVTVSQCQYITVTVPCPAPVCSGNWAWRSSRCT